MYKAICMYVVCTHIGEKCLCDILVTGYYTFDLLVVDCLSVFIDISRVFCIMKVANEIQCIQTYNQYMVLFHFSLHTEPSAPSCATTIPVSNGNGR